MIIWSYIGFLVTSRTIYCRIPFRLGATLYAFLQMAIFTLPTVVLFVMEFSPCMKVWLVLTWSDEWSNVSTNLHPCYEIAQLLGSKCRLSEFSQATNWTFRDEITMSRGKVLTDADLAQFPANGFYAIQSNIQWTFKRFPTFSSPRRFCTKLLILEQRRQTGGIF